MNSATRDSFTIYVGAPKILFISVMVLLGLCLGIVILKITLSAWNDVRTREDFDVSDFFTTLMRSVVVMLIFSVIFFH
jgi:ABC-type arginine transport system permease subunit